MILKLLKINYWPLLVNFSNSQNYNDKRNCWFTCFLYFANGLLTLAISSDKYHPDVIFGNGVFHFVCNVACYCIIKLNRYPFHRSYKYHWFNHTGLIFLKSSFFLYLSMPIVNDTSHARVPFYSLKPLLKTKSKNKEMLFSILT